MGLTGQDQQSEDKTGNDEEYRSGIGKMAIMTDIPTTAQRELELEEGDKKDLAAIKLHYTRVLFSKTVGAGDPILNQHLF